MAARTPARNKAKNAKAAKGAKARAAAPSTPASWWESSVQFLREVKTELKKVTWPNKRQVMSSTAVVLVLVGIVSVLLGFVDFILARLVRLVVG
jgi:preprotein translocase subunit SecE